MIRAVEAGEVGTDPFEDPFVDLLDATGRVLTGRRATAGDPRGAGLEGLDPIERVPAET